MGDPVVEVSAGLIFRNGRLLITQRHADAHLGGLWEFPGGKREPNETFPQCLVRELREELGVEVMVGRLLERIFHSYPEKTVRLEFYLCQLRHGEPRPIGCAALKWVAADELQSYKFPEADAQLLERLRKESNLWAVSSPG
ncbi:MAG: 8-oxo-dGTP diphosphatase MutT [Verrucomicrobiae bacterium]|nr:8-oxo-dGTP diphosphatase MutT [Verrucomicrobiae bacterium]